MASKKLYEALATALGANRRLMGEGADDDTWASANRAVAEVLLVDDPAFDSVRFHQWSYEVANGIRDLNGRK